MPDSYMVTYKVNGASHMAGPYPQLDEAHYQADDIATFVGVTDVEVVPEHHIAEPLASSRSADVALVLSKQEQEGEMQLVQLKGRSQGGGEVLVIGSGPNDNLDEKIRDAARDGAVVLVNADGSRPQPHPGMTRRSSMGMIEAAVSFDDASWPRNRRERRKREHKKRRGRS